MEKPKERKKVYILEEREYETLEKKPPNFHSHFYCIEKWDKLEDEDL